MTCRTVWIHQPSDCLLMSVWFTKISTLSKTPKTSKQTSMHCRPGSVGRWFTGMYWMWLTQQSTLEWLSTSTVHGRNTSARQPEGQQHSCLPPKESPPSINIGQETGLRDSLGPFWSTQALYGTHTLNQTFTSWRLCNRERRYAR